MHTINDDILETYQAMFWFSSESIICRNKVKMAILKYFSKGTKIMGNHSKFYFSSLEKHPVCF